MDEEGHELVHVNHQLHAEIARCFNVAQQLRNLAEFPLIDGYTPTSRGAAKAWYALYTLAKYI